MKHHVGVLNLNFSQNKGNFSPKFKENFQTETRKKFSPQAKIRLPRLLSVTMPLIKMQHLKQCCN